MTYSLELVVVALFADLRSLAAQFAQVVQLGATNVTLRNEFDLVDNW